MGEKEVDQMTFFELAEAQRKDRQDRLDAGDENAALKFTAKGMQNRGVVQRPAGFSHNNHNTNNSKGINKGSGKGHHMPMAQNRGPPVSMHQQGHQMRQIPMNNKRPAAGMWQQ